MTEQKDAAGAPATSDAFARAYAAFSTARDAYEEAKEKVEAAQREQAARIAELPDDQRADMARLEVIADETGIAQLGDAAFARMQEAENALNEMMRLPAPSTTDLALKMGALVTSKWDHGENIYLDRLTADACTLSFQFANIWLEQWRSHGGSAVLDQYQGGRLSTFRPEFSLSPDSVALEKRQAPHPVNDYQRGWHATFFDGQMNALSDMLDLVPGTRAALSAMLAANPSKGLPTPETEAAMARSQS